MSLLLLHLIFVTLLLDDYMHPDVLKSTYRSSIREGVKKSKWKFKMVFAMKGGGLEFHIPILKNNFFENYLESFPDC